MKRTEENMQLLMLILKKVELIDELIKKLAESGVKGGTILDGTGMAKTLVDMDDLPMFGMLRHILTDEDKERSKVLMFVLKDEQVMTTRETIKKVIGDLNVPNTGIMFSIPITYVEGLGE
jgi:nitrogen regulatory protein PII